MLILDDCEILQARLRDAILKADNNIDIIQAIT